MLPNGECISVDGTVRQQPSLNPLAASFAAPCCAHPEVGSKTALQHLGHNLPDGTGTEPRIEPRALARVVVAVLTFPCASFRLSRQPLLHQPRVGRGEAGRVSEAISFAVYAHGP